MNIPPNAWLVATIACFALGCGFSLRSTRPGQRKRALVFGLFLLGMLSLVKWRQNQPLTDNQKAAAHLIHILKTDEHALLDHLIWGSYPRGPLDAKPGPVPARGPLKPGEHPRLADAEVQTACRIITALTEGDLDGLRAIIASYKFKPYARAQMAESLRFAFYKAGVQYRFMAHQKWFYVRPTSLEDGNYSVIFSAEDEEPEVHLMQEHKEHRGQFGNELTKTVAAHEVMRFFQMDIVQTVLSKQTAR